MSLFDSLIESIKTTAMESYLLKIEEAFTPSLTGLKSNGLKSRYGPRELTSNIEKPLFDIDILERITQKSREEVPANLIKLTGLLPSDKIKNINSSITNSINTIHDKVKSFLELLNEINRLKKSAASKEELEPLYTHKTMLVEGLDGTERKICDLFFDKSIGKQSFCYSDPQMGGTRKRKRRRRARTLRVKKRT